MSGGRPDEGNAGAPPVPGTLTADLPSAVGAMARYAEWLAEQGVVRGLIGPRERPRLWDRHLLNSLALVPLVPREAQVIDVGSGAGLPGLPIALARPDVEVTLLEPAARRVRFLEEVVADLGAAVRVQRGRAENVPPAAVDVVVARAVAPLSRLVPWCLPMLREGGRLLALKGASAQEELDEASEVLQNGGAARARVVTSTGPGGGTATVVEIVAGQPLPRRTGRGRGRSR